MSIAWTYWLPDLAPGADPRRPRHDERVGDAALVHLALPAPERRVAGDRPTPWVVVVHRRPTQLVDAGDRLRHRAALEVPRSGVVEGAVHPALGRGAVVGQDEHEGVVEPADLGEEVEDPAHVVVGVAQEGCEALHEARRDPLLVGRERVPRRHPLRPRRQLGARGEQAPFLLAGERRLAPGVPAGVEVAAVPLDPVRRRVVGRMARARAEIEEERLRGLGGVEVGEELHRPVGDVRAEVVAVLPRIVGARPDGCRRRVPARTGASPRRRSRRSGRSRAPAATAPATRRDGARRRA